MRPLQTTEKIAFSLWHGWIKANKVTMKELLDYFCEDNKIDEKSLFSKARFKPYPELRQKFMLIAYDAGNSYSAIGRFLKIHHTTIMHGVKKMKALVEAAPQA